MESFERYYFDYAFRFMKCGQLLAESYSFHMLFWGHSRFIQHYNLYPPPPPPLHFVHLFKHPSLARFHNSAKSLVNVIFLYNSELEL